MDDWSVELLLPPTWEGHASKATEMWSSMPSGFTHAEHLEAQSLQQARQVWLDKGGLETPMEFRQTDLW